jgi:E3 ubiquitin-protein ligase SHPRH
MMQILAQAKLAQLVQLSPTRGRKNQEAMQGLLACSNAIDEAIQDCQDRLVILRKKGEVIVAEAEANKAKKLIDHEDDQPDVVEDESDDEDGSIDSNELKMPKTPAGDEHRTRIRALHSRIRELQVVQHKIAFLLGDVYHVLGRTEVEDASYAKADALRKELLRGLAHVIYLCSSC